MQYILTQEEFDALNQKNIRESAQLKQTLQDLCTRVANSELTSEGETWNCVLTVDYEWYCDSCPVKKVCPYQYKHWSK